ncbi:MAG: DUF444 family protein [Desulfobacterales bacterium]|nr:DUF444 family protein [Desulfobacterales bacterium]
MDSKLDKYYRELKKQGLAPDREEKILAELGNTARHRISKRIEKSSESDNPPVKSVYDWNDLATLQTIPNPEPSYTLQLKSIDELLERDKHREEDGFPRKIRVGKMIKPGRGGKDKVVIVPTTVEEKFIHDNSFSTEEEEAAGGSGEGEEGEVIGEQPVREDEGSGAGPGQGEGESHEMESSAYDLGKILTEQFQLPNLKDKGKKRALSRYTYDLTDRHRGFGQILDKKATLRQILETNIGLGRVPDIGAIDPTGFLIAPNDKIYRVLSKEMDYESQAMIFFLRDYSGSMSGKPTEAVVSQHVLIYSWLLYQYERQVETRFILHDTEAKEVPDFYTYYNSRVAGGTKVAAAFKMVNEIVEKESLASDYNIYVFHGTDGDDWDTDGRETLPEIEKMLGYANRVGVTIAQRTSGVSNGTEVEKYLKKSGLLEKQADLIRLDTMQADADEPRLIEGIKRLISQD